MDKVTATLLVLTFGFTYFLWTYGLSMANWDYKTAH